MTPHKLLSSPEAAEFLGIRRRTLEDWRRRGIGPAYIRLGATCVRYEIPGLEAWIAERRITVPSPAPK